MLLIVLVPHPVPKHCAAQGASRAHELVRKSNAIIAGVLDQKVAVPPVPTLVPNPSSPRVMQHHPLSSFPCCKVMIGNDG